MTRHRRQCEGTYHLSCPICQHKFYRRDYYNAHLESKHRVVPPPFSQHLPLPPACSLRTCDGLHHVLAQAVDHSAAPAGRKSPRLLPGRLSTSAYNHGNIRQRQLSSLSPVRKGLQLCHGVESAQEAVLRPVQHPVHAVREKVPPFRPPHQAQAA
ncbi:uncharacterized protein LOC143293581 [Babylonia areolata]|uniref:uncharacterized protein LOC143293581 n=1 Tax=Babylonia areolata TaxID=304850 RepID=UPI003FD2D1C3